MRLDLITCSPLYMPDGFYGIFEFSQIIFLELNNSFIKNSLLISFKRF